MAQGETPQPTCFVIMPISDVETYEAGHFGRVYEHLIKPSCEAAGFKPVRADEVQVTNYIVVDILRKIVDAEMVVCDLSGRNPNVLYELGIRQAFNRRVVLIRDSRTPRIFDIQGLRDLEYDENLRIDKTTNAVESLSNLLKNTSSLSAGDVNSIIQLLGVNPPQVSPSRDALNAINDIEKRISEFENLVRTKNLELSSPVRQTLSSFSNSFRQILSAIQNPALQLRSGAVISKGTRVGHPAYGDGEVFDLTQDRVTIHFDSGTKTTLKLESSDVENLQVL